jgi:hypothetical protein
MVERMVEGNGLEAASMGPTTNGVAHHGRGIGMDHHKSGRLAPAGYSNEIFRRCAACCSNSGRDLSVARDRLGTFLGRRRCVPLR